MSQLKKNSWHEWFKTPGIIMYIIYDNIFYFGQLRAKRQWKGELTTQRNDDHGFLL